MEKMMVKITQQTKNIQTINGFFLALAIIFIILGSLRIISAHPTILEIGIVGVLFCSGIIAMGVAFE